MPRTETAAPRLFVSAPLAEGGAVPLTAGQANYLIKVMRLAPGGRALVFNGRDGEHDATLAAAAKKGASLIVGERMRAQEQPPDLDYLFAPLKHARLDYVAQKAVEMGAGRLIPVLTRRTQVSRLNGERLKANAIEAAEQCGITWVPETFPLTSLDAVLAGWPADRLLIFCDEAAPTRDPVRVLRETKASRGAGLLIGPEGGFEDSERRAILALPRVVQLSLGPRVLRADTAAVAALALIQATFGDWADVNERS